MAKELLKEAIADAKAVREVAMQNAKLALEEAFNSKIQSMLAAKLNEELDDEELEEVYNEDEDNMEEGSYMEDEKEMEEGMEYEEDEFEEPIDYTMGKGSGPGTNQLPNPPAEINLEEILASLEEEMKEELDEEIDLTLEEDEDEELEEEINLDALMEELMEEETVEEELEDLEESFFGDIIKKVKATVGGSVAKAELDFMEKHKTDLDKLAKAEKDNDADELRKLQPKLLNDLNGWLTGAYKEFGIDNQTDKSLLKKNLTDIIKNVDPDDERSLIQKLATGSGEGRQKVIAELNEAYSTIETLRTQLAEVNLLNAKLLYVNKLFKANNLTEAQKLKVVEALDEATNVKEAKLVFNTLKESFESTGLKKNITEGFGYASKATGAPAKKKILTEQADETVARFQKLANIKF